jgi:DNA mismatch repair protein MutS
MGDFYEMFFEDAKVASKALDIALTSRNKNESVPVPMCGVPARAVQTYLARLIEQGFRVAVCDQTEDPASAKGLVRREVVRVITPGMIVENEFLDEKTNNYILAITKIRNRFGMAWLDISTATFRIAESEDMKTLSHEIQRISPREVLMPESLKQDSQIAILNDVLSGISVNYQQEYNFDYREGRTRLIEQLNVLSLEGFGAENLQAAIAACGALLLYVADTQKQKIEHLNGLETWHFEDHLLIDELSCRNLELFRNLRSGSRQGTLIEVIDLTMTAMGARLLQHWLKYPLRDIAQINARLDAVSEAKDKIQLSRSIRESLKSIHDIERLAAKISMGHANPRDMLALKNSLMSLPQIQSLVARFESSLLQWQDNLQELNELSDLIDKTIREDAPPVANEGGIIKPGYHPELDELCEISRNSKDFLAKMESKERAATGIGSLKVRYNKVSGYYIEVSKANSKSVPLHYVRKQTLVNAERYITDELKQFEIKALSAEERRAALEYQIFQEIRSEIIKRHIAIQQAARFLAMLDCLLSFAEIAEQNDYRRPAMNIESILHLENGRHPVIEKMICGERFVPNTVSMDDRDSQILMITGPNMAGKSTVLRQVALIVLMAHTGMFVPAQKADVCITDRIFTRVGALDNLSQGQSTFMVEMQETANILNNATSQSLVIMDEIGRGTSTYDGLSIAWAVAEYLHDLKGKGVKTLFATHYHELTDLAILKPRVKNFAIAVRESGDRVIFLRKLVEGAINKSYGIQVAGLAGIPEKVVSRAKKILEDIEGKKGTSVRQLQIAETPASLKRKSAQIDLFKEPTDEIISELKKLDISGMTPLDALNCLSRLKSRI